MWMLGRVSLVSFIPLVPKEHDFLEAIQKLNQYKQAAPALREAKDADTA